VEVDSFKQYCIESFWRRTYRGGSLASTQRLDDGENSMRGGITTISQRYASANNLLIDGYNSDEAKRYIVYLNVNSLYATAQSEPLPVGNFRFLTESEIENFDLASVEKDAEMGFIIECDLSYPSHLHDSHNDYPLAPEHLIVTYDMLSPFTENLVDPT